MAGFLGREAVGASGRGETEGSGEATRLVGAGAVGEKVEGSGETTRLVDAGAVAGKTDEAGGAKAGAVVNTGDAAGADGLDCTKG